MRSVPSAALWGAALLALPGANAQAQRQAQPLSASQAAAQVCAGKLSSVALVQAAVQSAKDNAALNLFITLDEAGALAAARQVDAQVQAHRQAAGPGRQRPACGALAGVPIVVKDNIHAAGLPATGGTPGLKGHVPTADAPVLDKLRRAGAIVLGKTTMHELAFGISGWNPVVQTGPEPGVRNAYDRSRAAGGSSSGTAAALGARVVAAGLGTDTGGSVRIPCAFNGCASLRPTMGRYSQEGIVPLSHSRDTAGPMALAMADVELLDRLIAGGPPAQAAALKSVRLGLVKDTLANLDADTRAAFDATLLRLKAAGVKVVEVEMPQLMALNGQIGFPLALYEAHDGMVAYLAKHRPGMTIAQLAEAIVSPDVKATYQGLVLPRKLPGPDNSLVDAKPAYDAAIATARPALRQLYADTFKQHRLDGLVFPTVPKVAMPANAESSSLANFVGAIQNTDPGSNAGLPGLQLPVALGASSRLPIGLEIDGPEGSDRRLVAIGLALEKLLGRLPAPGQP